MIFWGKHWQQSIFGKQDKTPVLVRIFKIDSLTQFENKYFFHLFQGCYLYFLYSPGLCLLKFPTGVTQYKIFLPDMLAVSLLYRKEKYSH